MAEVRLEAEGGKSLDELARRLEKLEKLFVDLKRQAAAASGQEIDFDTAAAEDDVAKLIRELRKLERAFESAERAVDFARARNQIEQTAQSARRLADAEARLAARGKQLIEFSKGLPPSLRQSSREMDRLEKETLQAESAFRKFQSAAGGTSKGLGSLISSVNTLRAGFAAFLAALGVQQIFRVSRAIFDLGKSAVETKVQFDKLLPGLRAFTGSTELAEEVADRLAATADRLRTPLAGLVDPFVAIQAGGREAGLSISEINNLFEASLVSARAFGKGAEEVQRLLTGISQVAGKGVASMEEFRQQIGESVPNAIPALAKGLSQAEGRLVTTAEAIARISSGSLDSATSLRALTAGFEALNSEASAGQLNTLQGDIGALARESEKARAALADGLERGVRSLIQSLTEFIAGNEDTIRSLGSLATAATDPIENLLDIGLALQVIGQESEAGRERIQGFFDGLAGGLQSLPGLAGLSEEIRNIGRAFTGSTGEARQAFQEIEDRARQLVLGVNKSAEQILEEFRESFKEQAKAAGAADKEIEQSAKDLASAVGKIAEASVKERKALEAARVKVHGGSTEQIQEAEKLLAARVSEIERQALEERKQLLQELIESTKRATEERIRLEAEAAEKNREEAEKIVATAKAVAAQRIAEDEQLATKRKQIEQEADEKIVEAKNQFVERLKKPKADREKLEQDLADRVVEIQRDAAEKIRAEEEKLAQAAERAAERRRQAEEKVQEARQKSIEQLSELRGRLDEIAQGEEGTSALGQVGDDAKELSENLGEATSALGDFLISLDQLNAGDLGDPLAGLSDIDPRSGANAAGFFGGISQGAEDAGEAVGDFRAELDTALEAAEGLTGGARQAILDLIERYSDLAESGTATREDFASFRDDLTSIGAEIGAALDSPVEQIRQRIDELRTSQEEAAESAQETAGSFQEAGETAEVAWDPLTRTLSTVEEAAGGAANAAEDLGVRIERTADGIKVTNEALQETQGASETAAEGLRQTGQAAAEATENITAVAAAAEPLKGEIVGETEPEKIRQLGESAGTAAEPVRLLSEGAGALAAASTTLGEQLPLIQTALPEIQAAVAGILETISGSEVDFGSIGANIAAIQEPLSTIGVSLTEIDTATAALPEKIQALQEAATPLFDQVLAAADDERFNRIATGLSEIDVAAQKLPDPLERIRTALVELADRKEDLQAALQVTRDGLLGVASEEVLGLLADLIDRLDEFQGHLIDISKTSSEILATWQSLDSLLPGLATKVREYGEALSQAANAETEASARGDELAETLGLVRDRGSEAVNEVNRFGEESVPAVEALNSKLRQTVDLLGQVREAAEQANQATQAISVGTGA